MPPCRCSGCDPIGAIQIITKFPFTRNANFDELMSSPTMDPSLFSCLHPCVRPEETDSGKVEKILVCKENDPIRTQEPMIELAAELLGSFEGLFLQTYPGESELIPSDLFTVEDAWGIVKNYDLLNDVQNLQKLLGSEVICGTYAMVGCCIHRWKSSDTFRQYKMTLDDAMITSDQEYLDSILLASENQEIRRLRSQERGKKQAEITERRRARLEKQEAKKLIEVKKKEAKRKRLEDDSVALAGFKLARNQEALHVCPVPLIYSTISN